MKDRIVYIDIIKAFAIFTVVLGHVCQNYTKDIEPFVNQYLILPYHMPLFIVLSGLFFKSNVPFMSFFKRKTQTIAIPYMVWCFIVYIIFRAIGDIYKFIFFTEPIHIMGWLNCFLEALDNWGWWFLRALYFSLIYAYVWIKLFKGNIPKAVTMSILVLWMFSFCGIIPNKFPLTLGFVFMYPIFALAIIIKSKWEYIENKSNLVLIASILLFSILMFFWKGYPDTFYAMNTSIFADSGSYDITGWTIVLKTIYRLFVGISGSMALILLFRKIHYFPKIIRIIQPIGRNTLGIYILHFFAFDIIKGQIFIDNFFGSLIISVVISILIIVACYFFVAATSKNSWCKKLLWGNYN